MLNDRELPPLGEPVDGRALATLITELESSGLEGSVTAIEYHRAEDAVTVSYLGDDRLREYHWIRGWSGATSLVTASDIPAGTRIPIRPQALLGAPAELDRMVDGATGADVILIGPAAGAMPSRCR
ncbi:hypothetical protein [Tessaracoccus coleopterorum]|uniref:hypothetical protein n=1 Tax=Tessaracoccus coleopterorum TaxID=2714950 RepID=UPI001E39BBB6|nr:hypothetical protein [Tessaracoccus coleopterorum]